MELTFAPLANANQHIHEKKIYKFISTLSSLDIISRLCKENNLITGLKNKRIQFKSEFEINKYKNVVYPKLGITTFTSLNDISKKESTALYYAEILKKYKPDNSGYVHEFFNYFELVSVINIVFAEHVKGQNKIFFTGIAVSIENKIFYAKVQQGKIHIIPDMVNPIGSGSIGIVCRVHEIATNQSLAFKIASSTRRNHTLSIQLEIANLKNIHKNLSNRIKQFEGIQDPVIADFELPENKIIGFLGTLYEIKLVDWINDPTVTPTQRISCCKIFIKTYMALIHLDLWHGDIKTENIMLKNNRPILIDWAGLLKYADAAQDYTRPGFYTRQYLSPSDFTKLIAMQSKKDALLKTEYILTAKRLELFAIGVVLYEILTTKYPFVQEEHYPELKFTMPLTRKGIQIKPLHEKKYSNDIIHILKKMLAHDPENRFTPEETWTAWENIDETKGKFRSKKYQLI